MSKFTNTPQQATYFFVIFFDVEFNYDKTMIVGRNKRKFNQEGFYLGKYQITGGSLLEF